MGVGLRSREVVSGKGVIGRELSSEKHAQERVCCQCMQSSVVYASRRWSMRWSVGLFEWSMLQAANGPQSVVSAHWISVSRYESHACVSGTLILFDIVHLHIYIYRNTWIRCCIAVG